MLPHSGLALFGMLRLRCFDLVGVLCVCVLEGARIRGVGRSRHGHRLHEIGWRVLNEPRASFDPKPGPTILDRKAWRAGFRVLGMVFGGMSTYL